MTRFNAAEPYRPSDRTLFSALALLSEIKPQDQVILKDDSRWVVLRLIATRDARGNLRYACMSKDGNRAEVISITEFSAVERSDIQNDRHTW